MVLRVLLVVMLLSAVPLAAGAQQREDVDETQPVAIPEPSDLAVAYYTSGNLLWVANLVWSVLVLVAVLATGISARLRDLALRLTRHRWFLALTVYFILFTLITSIVDLPRAYYEEFVRQHAYGLSNQTPQILAALLK